jgi:hypothetical protein
MVFQISGRSVGAPTLTVQGGLERLDAEDHAVMASHISRGELHVKDRGGNTPMLEDTVVAHRLFGELRILDGASAVSYRR